MAGSLCGPRGVRVFLPGVDPCRVPVPAGESHRFCSPRLQQHRHRLLAFSGAEHLLVPLLSSGHRPASRDTKARPGKHSKDSPQARRLKWQKRQKAVARTHGESGPLLYGLLKGYLPGLAVHDVLGARVVIQGVSREVATVAGALESAPGHLCCQSQVGVDPYGTGLKPR